MFEELLDRFREIREAPWSVVSLPKLIGALVAVGLLLLIYLKSEEGWIPILDSANLVFHEAGHPIFGVFGETIGFLGGTLMQLLVPGLVLVSCWYKRQAVAVALCGVWMAENGFNIARYMADARTQELPLVGSGEHDWGTLFGQWGLLHRDTAIAGAVRGVAWIWIVVCCAWLVSRYRENAR